MRFGSLCFDDLCCFLFTFLYSIIDSSYSREGSPGTADPYASTL